MNNKSSILTLIVVLIIAIGSYFFPKLTVEKVIGPTGPQGPRGEIGLTGPQGPQGIQGPRGATGPSAAPVLGSVTGPDSFFDCENHNGVTTCNLAMTARLATTTPCSFKNPLASSTLSYLTFRNTTGSTTAITVRFAKAKTPNATTTAIGTAYVLASLESRALMASTSPSALDAAITGTDSDYFNVGLSGGVGPAGLSGACFAQFRSI